MRLINLTEKLKRSVYKKHIAYKLKFDIDTDIELLRLEMRDELEKYYGSGCTTSFEDARVEEAIDRQLTQFVETGDSLSLVVLRMYEEFKKEIAQ